MGTSKTLFAVSAIRDGLAVAKDAYCLYWQGRLIGQIRDITYCPSEDVVILEYGKGCWEKVGVANISEYVEKIFYWKGPASKISIVGVRFNKGITIDYGQVHVENQEFVYKESL